MIEKLTKGIRPAKSCCRSSTRPTCATRSKSFPRAVCGRAADQSTFAWEELSLSSKNIFVKAPRTQSAERRSRNPAGQAVVLTGLSGSGKSSLAFDTIYAEGQRRYVESLSSYARQFLGQMEKPDVDYIEGLSPAISIDQKTTSKNSRSTVGTVTEIYDYSACCTPASAFRTAGMRPGNPTADGRPDCRPGFGPCRREPKSRCCAPVVRARTKGEHLKEFEAARKSGYVRVRADGILYDLSETKTEKNKSIPLRSWSTVWSSMRTSAPVWPIPSRRPPAFRAD